MFPYTLYINFYQERRFWQNFLNEIFLQIRGVASKQIVKDKVETTAQAKFISHGQVMCPLPEFDIHRAGVSSDEIITNLKDNTDHTRY